MKYIDGTNIYAATIQEYTRKIAVAAYAGKEMTQDDIQEMLAALLAEMLPQLMRNTVRSISPIL